MIVEPFRMGEVSEEATVEAVWLKRFCKGFYAFKSAPEIYYYRISPPANCYNYPISPCNFES